MVSEKDWRAFRRTCWALVAIGVFFLTLQKACAQSFAVAAPAGKLYSIPIEVSDSASVMWEARSPLNLDYMVFGNAIVFDVDQEIVVAATVIDWDARKFEKKTFIVTPDGSVPTPPKPDPPGPDDGGDDTPEDDIKPDLTKDAGDALRQVWAKRKITKGDAEKAAAIFDDHSTQMFQLRGGTVQSHMSAVFGKLKDLGLPSAAVGDYIAILQSKDLQTMREHALVLQDMAKALRR